MAFFVHLGKSSCLSLPAVQARATPRKAGCGTSESHVCTSIIPSSPLFNEASSSSSRASWFKVPPERGIASSSTLQSSFPALCLLQFKGSRRTHSSIVRRHPDRPNSIFRGEDNRHQVQISTTAVLCFARWTLAPVHHFLCFVQVT